MTKRFSLNRLLILAALIAMLAFGGIALAQDATPEAPAAENESEVEAAQAEEAAEEAAEEEAAAEEESENPLDALGINLGGLISQLINFGVIFFILTTLLWRPITNMLDNRSATIAKGLEDAAAAANARRNAEAEAERILAQARAEAARIVEEGRARGDEVAKGVQSDARTEADRIRQEARVSAEAERNAELAGLRGQVTAISMALAQRLIGANLDETRQRAMVDEFFTKVPESARALSGPVTVVSAMPLGDAEKSKISQQLGSTDVTYAVDPSILGGLVVRAGDRVIDGSVRSGLNDLAARLN
ncbi:MAG: F0F1 ATP synthase subunit B [bacterium]|nr:F0F1 ATP synthase subunit B [bacterium]